MDTVIYFIRHAQSSPTHRLFHSDWPLSEQGKDQASKIIPILEKLHLDKIISSPFIRCLDTVRPYIDCSSIHFEIHEDLRERHVVDTVVENFNDIWIKSWDDFNFAVPGCENSFDAQKRFVQAINDISESHPKSTIGVSTHGNVLGLFLHHLDNSNQRLQAEKIRNPDIIKVRRINGKYIWDQEFQLPELNEISTGHGDTPVEIKK